MTVNDPVEQFLMDITLTSPQLAEIIEQIRKIYRKVEPLTEERIIYGGVCFFLNGKHFSGAYPHKKHVNLTFGKGYEMTDPQGILQGKGKFRRHIQIFDTADLNTKGAETFIKQSIDLQKSV